LTKSAGGTVIAFSGAYKTLQHVSLPELDSVSNYARLEVTLLADSAWTSWI